MQVSQPQTPGSLRDALARALGDPSLEIVYWLPEDDRYVDRMGHPIEAPAPASGNRAVTVIDHDGQRLAALLHDPQLLDEPDLVEAAAAAARLALQNARLQAELLARLEEVRSSRARIVAAGDAERRRIERDLHDGAQQRLLGIRLTHAAPARPARHRVGLSRAAAPRGRGRARRCHRGPPRPCARHPPRGPDRRRTQRRPGDARRDGHRLL